MFGILKLSQLFYMVLCAVCLTNILFRKPIIYFYTCLGRSTESMSTVMGGGPAAVVETPESCAPELQCYK